VIYFSGIQGFYKEYGRNPQRWYREHRDSIGIPQGSVGECNILLEFNLLDAYQFHFTLLISVSN